jgi:hypothetical protein
MFCGSEPGGDEGAEEGAGCEEGKIRSERRTRERYWSVGCVEMGVVKGIIVMEVVTEIGQRAML